MPISARAQCATPGKDGSPGTLTGIINTYYPGTASVSAGATSITLGTARGATTAISSGDLLMVIQMQDASINSSNNSRYGDGNNGDPGSGYSNANNSGSYEFVKANNSVALSGGTLNLTGTGAGSGLINAYTNAAFGSQGQRRFQVVRVPQYINATTSSGLTAAIWDGTTGGILAFDVQENLTLSGTVSVNGLGFRGGAGGRSDSLKGGAGSNSDYRGLATDASQGSKGEGIAGTPRWLYDPGSIANVDTGVEGYLNGSTAMGAPGNAGGGGTDGNPSVNDENAGGGGGGNGGAGGRGGNSWNSNLSTGGFGGTAFAERAAGRLVMGGGGGSGSRNNDDGNTAAASGAPGGGIVHIRARKIFGTGTITANGSAAYNNTLNDGAGGGGGGGSVLIFALSTSTPALTINARGGRGGDAWNTEAANGNPGERHGPGGGGGGGFVIVPSTLSATISVTGGANGITTTSNDAFGATAGGNGASVTTLTSGQIPGIRSGAQCVATPTAIDLDAFSATAVDGKVYLEWKTGYEVNNLGFNLYREAAGQRTQLNPTLVAGSALLARNGTAFTSGFSYAWMDSAATTAVGKANALYWLEDVDINGKRTMHGPISALPGSKLPAKAQALLLSQLQTGAPDTSNQRLVMPKGAATSATPVGNPGAGKAKGAGKSVPSVPASLQTQWDIAAQPGVKLLVNQDGWVRVTQPELLAAGFDVARDPLFLQLFADGQEVPVRLNGGRNGRLEPKDSIEFFAQAFESPHTNLHTYYVLNGSQAGRRIPVVNGQEGEESRAASFLATVERRPRSIYFAGWKNGEADNWLGPIINGPAITQTLRVTNLNGDAADAVTLEVALQGVTDDAAVWPDHSVKVVLNGEEVGTINFDGQQHSVQQFGLSARQLAEGDNTLSLQATGGSMDVSLLDYVRLTYAHRFEADNNTLMYTANGRELVQIGGFSTPNVRVFDLTDPANAQEVQANVESAGKGYCVKVAAPDLGPRVLYAVGEKGVQTVAQAVTNQPSSWHQSTQGADVLILAHRNFLGSVVPLKTMRQAQGYAVAVVDVEDLYDEFGYGARSPQAIKDFLTLAVSSWKRAPRYVVLVGDASYDPKNYLGLGDNDYVPTKMLETLQMETACDDWYGDLDGDDVADLAIGRLPVRTADDAARVVGKLVSYEQEGRPEGALLVSDRNDGFDFEGSNAGVKSLLPGGMAVTEVKRSQMTDAGAHQAIVEGIGRGPQIVNYAGHGSVGLWRGSLLMNADAAQMRNGANLSVVVTMTCLNGQFNTPYDDSLAEALMKAESGGAVAVWASSSLTIADGQGVMDQELIRQLLNGKDAKGNSLSFGEAVKRAKAALADADVRRSWVLFGDPSMKLK